MKSMRILLFVLIASLAFAQAPTKPAEEVFKNITHPQGYAC